jgi:hypothetical protein
MPSVIRAHSSITTRYRWPISLGAAATVVVLSTNVDLGTSPGPIRALAVLAAFVAEALLLVAPGIAALALATRKVAAGPATGMAMVFAGSGSAALVTFWAWYASPDLGRATSVTVLVASALVLALLNPQDLVRTAGMKWPLLTALFVGMFFIGLAFVQGGIHAGALHTVGLRFWVSPDNKVPLLFAERLADARPLRGFLIGNWHSSDRPPLQSGIVLGQYPLFGDRVIGYQLLATAAQMAWLPATWAALRGRGYGERRIFVVLLATATTGVVFVNSVFVWPKMLAGGFAIAALAVLVSRVPADRWRHADVLVAVLCGLSFLSHGGTAFALLALIPAIYVLVKRRSTWRGVAVVALTLGVLYVPWYAYQRLVDPPGDRLIKWQLAGVIEEDPRSAPRALIDQYRSLSFGELIDHKAGNVLTLIARPAMWQVDPAGVSWRHGFFNVARIAQLNNLACSAGPLLLGLAALFVPASRRRLGRAPPLALFTVLAVLAWVLLLFGGEGATTIIATGPYAAVLMFIALLALGVTVLPRWAASAILAINALWFALCWIPGLGFRPALPEGTFMRVDGAMVGLCVVAVSGLAWVALRIGCFTRRTASTPPTVCHLSGATTPQ